MRKFKPCDKGAIGQLSPEARQGFSHPDSSEQREVQTNPKHDVLPLLPISLLHTRGSLNYLMPKHPSTGNSSTGSFKRIAVGKNKHRHSDHPLNPRTTHVLATALGTCGIQEGRKAAPYRLEDAVELAHPLHHPGLLLRHEQHADIDG